MNAELPRIALLNRIVSWILLTVVGIVFESKLYGQPPSNEFERQQVSVSPTPKGNRVPVWAKDAVFYQIFPERFRNGDPENDPTRDSLEFPERVPKSWSVTPWKQQWYARSSWEKQLGRDFYQDGVFHRRYGGDLQGVIDKLDYLAELGVNAIYFNPLFWGRSLHKYDGNSFHHIDPHFGPDPKGDFALIASESSDPASWTWTAADKLFLELISKARARRIRIVIDGVFNHTGRDFFAFDDIRKNQRDSEYVDWYRIQQFDDPETPVNEFKYKGWWDVPTLPEFADNAEGTDLHPEPNAYIYQITRRWMDPNGDGNPEDGVDGWRLDVAPDMPNAFWRNWNAEVRNINPHALTIAETWEEAGAYLSDCGFSSAMNYYGFAMPVKGFLIDGTIKASEVQKLLIERMRAHPVDVQFALQNLIDSHDTSRAVSMIINADRKRPYLRPETFDYDVGERVSPRHSRDYVVTRPTEDHWQRLKLLALFQFTFVGPPMIYYGTETGMDGADDPCCRMPMIWNDLKYDSRSRGPFGLFIKPTAIRFDAALHDYFRSLILLRRTLEPLRRGSITFVHCDDEAESLAFARGKGASQVLVAINRGQREATIRLDLASLPSKKLTSLFHSSPSPGTLQQNGDQLSIVLSPNSGEVWRFAASDD